MSHADVKAKLLQEADQRGLKKSELKVTSTDPFFVGTPRDYEESNWAASYWGKMMAKRKKPLHLRGFHYWLQSQGLKKPDGEKYAHGKDPAKDWTWLLHAAQMARYLGVGEWVNFIDLKHPDPTDYDNYWVGSGLAKDGSVDVQQELQAILDNLVNSFINNILRNTPEYHTEGYQLAHLEVWCEKNSMKFAIEPSCRRFKATYQPLVGQSSVEKVNLCSQRAIKAAQAGKIVRIFYIADFDRYGWSMVSAVARKLEFYVQEHNLDLKVTRLALNEDQIKKFNLPKAPKHGEEVVELDALEAIHPGELGNIVSNALVGYYDSTKPQLVEAENKRIRDRARKLVEEKLRKPLEEEFKNLDVSNLGKDFSLTQALDKSFKPPEPGYKITDKGSWVLDTQLSYWDQLEAYKIYKGERIEEEA